MAIVVLLTATVMGLWGFVVATTIPPKLVPSRRLCAVLLSAASVVAALSCWALLLGQPVYALIGAGALVLVVVWDIRTWVFRTR